MATHTETVGLLVAVLEAVIFRDRRRTLQAEIVRCQGRDRPTVVVCGCLRHDGGVVEDATEDHFVMRNAAVHDILPAVEKQLHMFWSSVSIGSPHSLREAIVRRGSKGLTYHSRTSVSLAPVT